MRWIKQRFAASGSDDGIALVVAVSLVALVGVLVLSLVAVAMSETGATGRDRQRSQAVMAAESQVDTLMSTIQSTLLADLPCGTQPDRDVSVVSDQLSVVSEVNYFQIDPATGTETELTCDDVRGGIAQPTHAQVTATATSERLNNTAPGRRTVEAFLELSPSYGIGLDKAIFGDGMVRLSNAADIYGEDGEPNADVYTNGDLQCQNNQTYHGSIYAQGSVSLANTCVIAVDVHVRGNINATNPGVSINGRALSSNGNISLTKADLGQQARAAGTVTGDVCATPDKCFSGVEVPPPPKLDFPVLNFDEQAWRDNGYNDIVTIPNADYPCGWWNGDKLIGPDGKPRNLNGKVDGAAAWIYEHSFQLAGPTVLISHCTNQAVTFQGTGIVLNDHLAVFSDAGVKFTNNSPITALGSDEVNLYLIQPYDAVTADPCNVDGIALDNQVTVAPNVNVLMYTPCNIRKANSTTYFGQIYAGNQALVDNKTVMYYKPLPIWGIEATGAVEAYNIEILYKRENV